jgi:hypothetical protein
MDIYPRGTFASAGYGPFETKAQHARSSDSMPGFNRRLTDAESIGYAPNGIWNSTRRSSNGRILATIKAKFMGIARKNNVALNTKLST